LFPNTVTYRLKIAYVSIFKLFTLQTAFLPIYRKKIRKMNTNKLCPKPFMTPQGSFGQASGLLGLWRGSVIGEKRIKIQS
jgi:hypothetical protein